MPDFMIALKVIGDKENQSLNDIHFATTITYSHLHHIKKIFLDKEWITCIREGRRFRINLTEKGKSVLNSVLVLFDNIGINNDNIKEFRQKTKHKPKETEDTENITEEVESNGRENQTTH